jgi:hypothetical protein
MEGEQPGWVTVRRQKLMVKFVWLSPAWVLFGK